MAEVDIPEEAMEAATVEAEAEAATVEDMMIEVSFWEITGAEYRIMDQSLSNDALDDRGLRQRTRRLWGRLWRWRWL